MKECVSQWIYPVFKNKDPNWDLSINVSIFCLSRLILEFFYKRSLLKAESTAHDNFFIDMGSKCSKTTTKLI